MKCYLCRTTGRLVGDTDEAEAMIKFNDIRGVQPLCEKDAIAALSYCFGNTLKELL